MQIKEYEAYTLKECLQQVRDDLGPEAVILETRKIRKGGVMGLGARDAVCIVAATGIAVKEDVAQARRGNGGQPNPATPPRPRDASPSPSTRPSTEREVRAIQSPSPGENARGSGSRTDSDSSQNRDADNRGGGRASGGQSAAFAARNA